MATDHSPDSPPVVNPSVATPHTITSRGDDVAVEVRDAIVSLYLAGVEERSIASQVRRARKTVQRVIREYRASSEPRQRPRVLTEHNRKRRERLAELRSLKRQRGICLWCDQPAKQDFYACERHAQSERNRRKGSRERDKCADCKQPPAPGCARCEACRQLAAARTRTIMQARDVSGLCRVCGKHPRLENRKSCQACGEKATTTGRCKRAERQASGLCLNCGSSPPVAPCRLCETCLLKATSNQHFGSVSRANDLLALFTTQSGKCAYSGLPIQIGISAQLDHIQPLSRGGSHDLSNVQWVHQDVNQMKRDLSEEVFLRLIVAIYQHWVA
jgi:hypothetical protein